MSLHTLMFGWEYPPMHLGGLGIACQGMVRGLLHNGVRVTLALPNPNTADDPGLRTLHPGTTKTSMRTVSVPSYLSPYDSQESYEQRIWQHTGEASATQEIYGSDLPRAIAHFTASSIEMTKDVRPNIVHCHDWMTYQAAALSAQHHGVPMVAHIHATELDRTHFSPDPWIYDLEKKGFKAADCIIAVSNYTKGILIENYGIPETKIRVVHNASRSLSDSVPSAPRSQNTRSKRPLILFLGRLAQQKGAHHFLEMAAKIRTHRPETQFVMAGSGPLLPELLEYACLLNIQDSVMFAGRVDSNEAKLLYRQADCFVMPSLSEPFGLVALEAASHGTPVILSRQSGASEVMAHAFHVDFWDTERMADCALTILREEALAGQLSSEASRSIADLTWEQQAGHIRSIYTDTLSAIK